MQSAKTGAPGTAKIGKPRGKQLPKRFSDNSMSNRKFIRVMECEEDTSPVDASHQSPLLNKMDSVMTAEGTSSFLQAGFNAVNILMGVGLLSLPFAMKKAGWFGLLILVAMASMTCYTGVLLNRCQVNLI